MERKCNAALGRDGKAVWLGDGQLDDHIMQLSGARRPTITFLAASLCKVALLYCCFYCVRSREHYCERQPSLFDWVKEEMRASPVRVCVFCLHPGKQAK
jgi:hypothetical protein